MSVTLTPQDLSNHKSQPWLIVVIVLVVIAWPSMGTAAAAYADAAALTSLLIAVGGVGAQYRHRSN
ncbi:hypothetical protein JIX56_22260 [Streptomyces sp. CA-210063]|uniref:hypothetical protein n=1 Tax=Streptomyces sp. CA-210063 TaxID=2801029 RepID=UPI00214BED0C|nr:hypothetical protein [Streptomyces sp. CA-210063]UUU32405.1 hypothetical protein JIX56_22260 [Streptomyces sp. CA-210063]